MLFGVNQTSIGLVGGQHSRDVSTEKFSKILRWLDWIFLLNQIFVNYWRIVEQGQWYCRGNIHI